MFKTIMFLGTGSDVGKSVAAAAFCRILKKRGFSVAPFKAQNMSNNSYVTIEGGEIGRAQAVQAEAAGLLPSVHMNPVLLKPSSDTGSQIVLHGKVFGDMGAVDYHEFKPRLKKAIMESFHFLAKEHDMIVIEGAGSCCEMNLKDNDLTNLNFALSVGSPCILVADIDKGGVFAQIIGTYNLMSRKERQLVMGFLINKFRGDPELFKSGIEYIERKTGKPVLGFVPYYHDIFIDSEDAVVIQEDRRRILPLKDDGINIAVLNLPRISNFTDMEILAREPDVVLNYLLRPVELTNGYDCLIIPGTKNVIEDMEWLSLNGWRNAIKDFADKKTVVGICGGYQIMGRKVMDPYGVESSGNEITGLGLLPVETMLEEKKIVRKVSGICSINKTRVAGYEIHMGRTTPMNAMGAPYLKIREPGKKRQWEDGWSVAQGRIAGTYVHGLFDDLSFRTDFLNALRKAKGLKAVKAHGGKDLKSKQYDKLARHFEKYCDVERIISSI
jgi:adenosylcobyric acid synthase